MPLLGRPRYGFSIFGNIHLEKDAEVPTQLSRIHSSKNIQQSTIPSTQSSSAQEEQASEQLSVSSNKDLKLPAFRSYSLLALTPQLLRVELTQPSATCTATIGDGTPTILSREATGLVTKMLFIICAKKPLKQFFNQSHTVFLSHEQNRGKYTKGLLEDNPENMEKVHT